MHRPLKLDQMKRTLLKNGGLNPGKFTYKMEFEIDHQEFYQNLYEKIPNDELDTHLFLFLDEFNAKTKKQFGKDMNERY